MCLQGDQNPEEEAGISTYKTFIRAVTDLFTGHGGGTERKQLNQSEWVKSDFL